METHDPDFILRDIVFMECVGMRPVVIHGGGGAINKRLKEHGITPRFVEGLRVTDKATMSVVEEVLLEVNRNIVARIRELGGRAEGFSWKDGIILARKHVVEVKRAGIKEEIDIGFVGDVERIEVKPIRELCRKDIIPVIAPVGVNDRGFSYNINADIVSGAVAAALRARKLVLMTDVLGILRQPENEDSLIGSLNLDDINKLIDAGVIRAGMLPKIGAAMRAVEAGVKKTHIIDGRLPHSLLLEIFTDKGIGTEIVGN